MMNGNEEYLDDLLSVLNKMKEQKSVYDRHNI